MVPFLRVVLIIAIVFFVGCIVVSLVSKGRGGK